MRQYLDMKGVKKSQIRFLGWDSIAEKLIIIWRNGNVPLPGGGRSAEWFYDGYRGFNRAMAHEFMTEAATNNTAKSMDALLAKNSGIVKGKASLVGGNIVGGEMETFVVIKSGSKQVEDESFSQIGMSDFILDGMLSWDDNSQTSFDIQTSHEGKSYAW